MWPLPEVPTELLVLFRGYREASAIDDVRELPRAK
jgi:hypothetical protein